VEIWKNSAFLNEGEIWRVWQKTMTEGGGTRFT
jgi:hypothetical protein